MSDGSRHEADTPADRLPELVRAMAAEIVTAIRSRSESPLLLCAAECARLTGISERKWWSMVSSGEAPKSLRFGGRTLWRRSEIDRLVEGL